MFWKNYLRKGGYGLLSLVILASRLPAQQQISPDVLQKILDRLDSVEKQNEALLDEVKELREIVRSAQAQSATATEHLEEKSEVHDQAIKDLAQTKISTSQRFSMSLTGMILFDSYLFTGTTTSSYLPNYSTSPFAENSKGGATLSQSIIGFDFSGPQLPGDGRVHGFLSMDFFGQAPNQLNSYDNVFRIRRGIVSFDWKRRSIIVGQDKSLIAPLQPTSYAQVGIPPLSGAGNLWLWLPQIRYQERMPISSATQATFEAAIVATNESYSEESYSGSQLPYISIQPMRPAVQARLALEHHWTDETRIAVGAAAHASESHINGVTIPSRVFSIDAVYKPLEKLEVSGTILYGKNFANLGGEPPGFTVRRDGAIIPIRGGAGWIQVALPVTRRLTFDAWAGRQVNNRDDIGYYGAVYRTLSYAGNVLYRLGPNIVIGFEGSKDELQDYNLHQLLTNRYDATVAYLF